MNGGILADFNSIPIIVIPDNKKQNRTHKKKRINKKWAKIYGYTISNMLENDQVYQMSGNMYMNPRTYYKIQGLAGKLV